MPNVSSFGTQTDNAVVQGTVTDQQMIIPEIPPQGLMSVGPRVSFNFLKLWDENTDYHYYDVVQNGAGASYIAIKPFIPAGTELVDGESWRLWAEPNAQISDLREIVELYDKRITQNTNDIATKAPVNHASEETVYGIGNEANYGHLRLANDDTPIISDANAGVAATPNYISKNSTYATPEMFGAIGDGITDDTSAITNFFNSGRALALTAGKVYKVIKPITTPQTFKYLNGNGATLKFEQFNNESFCIALDTAKSILCNLNVDCGGNKKGVATTSTRIKVTNLHVKNFTNVGFTTSTGTTSGYECTCDTLIIEAADAAANSIGISVERADCIFSNVYIQDCNIGFKLTQGYTLITNAHAWIRTNNSTAFNNSTMFAHHTPNPLNATNVYCDSYANMVRVPQTTANGTAITILNATMLQPTTQEIVSNIVQNYDANCSGVFVQVSINPANKIQARSNNTFNGRIKFENALLTDSGVLTKQNAIAVNQKLLAQVQPNFKRADNSANFCYLINNSFLALNYTLTTTTQIEVGTHELFKGINALTTYPDNSIISLVTINNKSEQLTFDGTNSTIYLKNSNTIPINTIFNVNMIIPIII